MLSVTVIFSFDRRQLGSAWANNCIACCCFPFTNLLMSVFELGQMCCLVKLSEMFFYSPYVYGGNELLIVQEFIFA
jgi:hypothetical protein